MTYMFQYFLNYEDQCHDQAMNQAAKETFENS